MPTRLDYNAYKMNDDQIARLITSFHRINELAYSSVSIILPEHRKAFHDYTRIVIQFRETIDRILINNSIADMVTIRTIYYLIKTFLSEHRLIGISKAHLLVSALVVTQGELKDLHESIVYEISKSLS